MARQPYFSGNYGSALAQIDTRPIMQGAAAQAAMYQGLGQNIGGAIEKYGLNKEREKKANARIKASIQGLDSYVEAGVITDAQRLQAKEMLQNPDASSSEKVAFIEQQEKQLFQLPKALLAKAQAGNAVLQNEITEKTKGFEVKNRELAGDLLKSQGVLAALKATGFTKEQKAALENLEARTAGVKADTAETIAETAGLPAEQATALEIKRKELEVLKQKLLEMPQDAKNRDDLAKVNLALKNLELGDEPGRLQRKKTTEELDITGKGLNVAALPKKLRDEATQRVIDQEKGFQDIEKSAAEYAKDASAEEVYSSAQQAEDAKKKAAATAKETEARTDKLMAELGALLEANKPIDDSMLVGVEDALLEIDIATAAGGDVAGWWQDTANWVAGIVPIGGGTGISPDRIRERTNLANLQGMVVPSFLRGISTHGGKWAREDIMRMIPQEDDSNAEMRSKIKRLIPHMRKKLVEAHHIYSKGTSNATARNTALQIKTQFPGVIRVLVRSVGGGDKIEKAEQFLREEKNLSLEDLLMRHRQSGSSVVAPDTNATPQSDPAQLRALYDQLVRQGIPENEARRQVRERQEAGWTPPDLDAVLRSGTLQPERNATSQTDAAGNFTKYTDILTFVEEDYVIIQRAFQLMMQNLGKGVLFETEDEVLDLFKKRYGSDELVERLRATNLSQ
jgi:hypothetical protein